MAHHDDDLAHVPVELGDDLDAMVVYNLLRTHSYLGPSIAASLRRQRLTAAQFNALLALRSAGDDGLLMGVLGRRLVVTKSNVTGLVDRLERLGLAVRGNRPDRRATSVQLTPAGRALLDRVLPQHAALLTELTGCLTRREKQTLVGLLTKLRRQLRLRRREAR